LIGFDATIVQVQRSFIKTKTHNKLVEFYFELFNIHISHLTQLPMINMALKWHHKIYVTKLQFLKWFWWLSNIIFGLFNCDCTRRASCWRVVLWISHKMDVISFLFVPTLKLFKCHSQANCTLYIQCIFFLLYLLALFFIFLVDNFK